MKQYTDTILEHQFWPVKSDEKISIGSTDPSMIHHKVFYSKRGKRILYRSRYKDEAYGVSSSCKVLPKGVLLKHWHKVRAFLRDVCNLSTKEVDVAQVLLRLQAYYPQVYPKASQVAQEAHVSIATFWRAVNKLRDMNLLEVVNQFLIRVEAQTSNLYLLNKLLQVIAKYLAEHIAHVWPEWLKPIIRLSWPDLWRSLSSGGDPLFPLSTSRSAPRPFPPGRV